MGRCRKIGRNVAKYNVKLSRKKTEKIFKKKSAKGDVQMVDTVDSEAVLEANGPVPQREVMEAQAEKTEHLRHLFLYEFNRGCSGAQAARNINAVYGEGFATKATANRWFAKFREGIFGLEDAPRSGRPSVLDEDHLEALLQQDNRQTCDELAAQLNCSHGTVVAHLQSMGKVQKLGAWVPLNLSEATSCSALTPATASLSSTEAMAVEGSELQGKAKQRPIYREDKLRRNELPLQMAGKQKGNEKLERGQRKGVKKTVVSAQQMSKKKARKVLKAVRRDQREKERRASRMDVGE